MQTLTRRSLLVVGAGLLSIGSADLNAAEARARILLAPDGRTLSAPASAGMGQPVRIAIAPPAPVPGDCSLDRPERGPLIVKYRYAAMTEQPDVLLPNDKEAIPISSGEYEIPGSGVEGALLVFNIWETSAPVEMTPTLKACADATRAKAEALEPLQHALDEAATLAEEAAATAAQTRAAIGELDGDLESLRASHSERAADEIADTVRALRDLRTRLLEEEAKAKLARAEEAKARRELNAASTKMGGSAAALKAKADRLSDYVAAIGADPTYGEAVIVKVGGLLAGDRVKAVNYDLGSRGAENVTTISPMGAYPVVRYGEQLSVALLNVVASRYPYPFTLRVKAQATAVINVAPVRPMFEPGALRTSGEGAAARLHKVRLADTVYRDHFLPVVGEFAPNDLPEVTLVTERAAADGGRTEVTLLDKARLPTFRALYRFNFNSGVMATGLRKPAFTKVKTADDDPGTTPDNEARYRVAEIEGDRRVLPMFAVTLYLVPVDVQGPVRWSERLIPNPTMGFAFANPADDVFLGFSHEVVRNLQLVWGVHFGKVSALSPRNDVSEDRDATAPVTHDVWRRAFTFGFTFNVAVVTKIFK